jgi:hexosaminidase
VIISSSLPLNEKIFPTFRIQFLDMKIINIAPSLVIILCSSFFFTACNSRSASNDAEAAFDGVIPKPVSVKASGHRFFITERTSIVTEGNNEVKDVAEYFARLIRIPTGYDLPVRGSKSEDDKNVIYLNLTSKPELGKEGYELIVGEDDVQLSANSAEGVFRGVQTIRQLLPAKIEHGSAQTGPWEIAAGTIIDYPEYEWRGSMLDVSRHFFGVEEIKKYIDYISYYKMNRLHLGLSNDQGWRIEIKSWPKLTEVGGSTQVGGGKGGFYTQEQYKEIVAYAQERYVIIVPEIDLPGHINAALASYNELLPGPPIKREAGDPSTELNDKPVAGKIYTGIEVGFSTLDYKKEITFKFVNDVIREIAAITPGPYFHIGGDEAAITKKNDYIGFVNRFKEIVKSNGKQMVGWEEISQGKIDSTVIIQHWDSREHAVRGTEKGAKIIFSPAKKTYLDMQYDSTTRLGLHWAAYIEVDSSYIWDPATRIPQIEKDQILGVEAPLWTETIATMDDIEYMAFPRLPGIAEIGWSASPGRDWKEYKNRLALQGRRWKEMGIDYYPSPTVHWME